MSFGSWRTRPSSTEIRYLRRRRSAATIPQRRDQHANRVRRGRAGGRPPAFDAARYAERNTVERALNKLKQARAVATRFDKRRTHLPGP